METTAIHYHNLATDENAYQLWARLVVMLKRPGIPLPALLQPRNLVKRSSWITVVTLRNHRAPIGWYLCQPTASWPRLHHLEEFASGYKRVIMRHLLQQFRRVEVVNPKSCDILFWESFQTVTWNKKNHQMRPERYTAIRYDEVTPACRKTIDSVRRKPSNYGLVE